MPITRNSKIKEVWKTPIGQDVLQKVGRRLGKSEVWAEGRTVAGRPLHALDKMAGKGFADALVTLLSSPAGLAVATPTPPSKAWWKESTFYRIYLPSFMDSDFDGIGEVQGVVQRLPYLARLGVDVLWLCPFWGMSVNEDRSGVTLNFGADLGSEQDFVILADAAHAQSMRVIPELDIVTTTDMHPWFLAAIEGDEKYQDYYYFREGDADRPPNNWGKVGISSWRWMPEMDKWVLCLSGQHRPDLNWNNPKVREEITAILKRWVDIGADGFALTPISTLGKDSLADANQRLAEAVDMCGLERHVYGLQLHNHLRELRQALGSELLLMGELPGAAPELAKIFTAESRAELNLLWDPSPVVVSKKRVAEGGRGFLQDMKAYYLRWADYSQECWPTVFFESPNLPRIVSRVGASPIYRSVVAKMLGTLMLTMRGTPILYQGEELGLPNTRFENIEEMRSARAQYMYVELSGQLGEEAAFEKILPFVPDHARTPMPWGIGATGGFTGAAEPWLRLTNGVDHLNATVQMQDKSSVWSHYHNLIDLRKANPGLQYGAFNPVFTNNASAFCYFRIHDAEKWYVEINITNKEIAHPGRITPSQKLQMSNYQTPSRTLRPYEANLYRCD